jgi:hydrogenase-4 membrane subunit HyfE
MKTPGGFLFGAFVALVLLAAAAPLLIELSHALLPLVLVVGVVVVAVRLVFFHTQRW